MRVTFLGNAPSSVRSLEAVAASPHEIALVATRVARPAGRGSALARTPVAQAAERLGVPLVEIDTVKSGDGFAAVKSSSPDVLAVVAYGEILPLEVLQTAAIAPVNVHFSLLPAYRGAAPVQRALMEGASRTGVSIMVLTEGMDEGPVLAREEVEIGGDDTAGSLGRRLSVIGARLLVDSLERYASGALRPEPQDDSLATYAPKVSPEEARIRWSEEAETIDRLVRALDPSPGAWTTFHSKRVKILRVKPVERTVGLDLGPGEIAAGSELMAGTAGRPVRVLEAQMEGRRRMSGAELARGLRPSPADRFE